MSGVDRVSDREREVLTALREGLTNAQIASRFHVSVRTVESHVSALLRKTGATDRKALASLASLSTSEPGRTEGSVPASAARKPRFERRWTAAGLSRGLGAPR